jgi:hypothetical protein
VTDQTARVAERFVVGTPQPQQHAGQVLAAIRSGEAADAAAVIAAEPFITVGALREELNALADADLTPAIGAAGGDVERQLARIGTAVWLRQVLATEREPAADHPLLTQFPGDVPGDLAIEPQMVRVPPGRHGWIGTGLYARPGGAVRVRRVEGQGVRLRIGAHSDTLWHKSTWQRLPVVAREMPLTDGSVDAFAGGPVYVVVPPDAGPVAVEIGGDVVPMATYTLGQTTAAEWRAALAESPAPWAELGCESLIFTVPKSAAEKLADPAPIMRHWQAVQQANARLAGIEPNVARPMRIVNDVQISAGYMHAGYPIMTHLDVIDAQFDLGEMKSLAAWGFYHELGHNHQHPAWTWGGLTEVTVNWFTLYALEEVAGLTPEQAASRVLTGRHAEAIEHHLAAIAAGEASDWTADPFLALGLFVELRLAHGWEPFIGTIASYHADGDAVARLPSDRRAAIFAERFGEAAGVDVVSIFKKWGVPMKRG